MASLNVPGFSNGQVADANAVTANFENVKTFVENQVVQIDGSVKAGTIAIADDAITAAKVKDNETLPVSVSGNAATASAVAWANVTGKPAVGDVFNNGGTYGINITGSAGTAGYATNAGNASTANNATLLGSLSPSSQGTASTIAAVGSDGMLAAQKFGAPVNASWWNATDWVGGLLFRANATSNGVYNTALTSGRAVIVASTGTIGYQSSSERYKKDITPVEIDVDSVLKIQTVTYKAKEEYLDGTSDDDVFLGVIAEQVDSLGLNHLIHYDTEGRPDSFKYELLSVALLAVAQNQEKRILELESRISNLENK